MRSHNGAVDDQIFHVEFSREMFQHIGPNTVIAPAGKPLVDVVPPAIFLGQHAPLGTGAVYPDHAFQEAATLLLVANIDSRMFS